MVIDIISPQNGKKSKMAVEEIVINEIALTIGYMGRSTIAVAKIAGQEGIGLAICMKGDKYSKDIGTNLAAARAIRHIADAMEETWNSRSVTKEEWKAKHKKG